MGGTSPSFPLVHSLSHRFASFFFPLASPLCLALSVCRSCSLFRSLAISLSLPLSASPSFSACVCVLVRSFCPSFRARLPEYVSMLVPFARASLCARALLLPAPACVCTVVLLPPSCLRLPVCIWVIASSYRPRVRERRPVFACSYGCAARAGGPVLAHVCSRPRTLPAFPNLRQAEILNRTSSTAARTIKHGGTHQLDIGLGGHRESGGGVSGAFAVGI